MAFSIVVLPIGHRVIGINRFLCATGFPFVKVLTGVNLLPSDKAKDVIEPSCQQRAKQRTNPVYPVISGETTVNHVRSEGASRIERTTGIIIAWEKSCVSSSFQEPKRSRTGHDIPINSATKKASPIPTGAK